MSSNPTTAWCWLRTGDETFTAMLAAIEAAKTSIWLESYIYAADAVGETFRAALVKATQRGVQVRVLIDAFGSLNLPASFWKLLTAAGGEFRWFNPLTLNRWGIRDHRKLLVCDKRVAFIGGFNLASEWNGDGVAKGWRDLGLQLNGLLAEELAASFDEMFDRAEFRHKRFMRLRKFAAKKRISAPNAELLLSGPGRGFSPIKRALRKDLIKAKRVQIIAAYFLPPWRIRRDLMRVARRGGQVQLILAGKSDVPLSRMAGQSLYQRLLRAGVEIYEYQPQILHAKLIVVDDVVYIGSANLDARSLHINYELLVRLPHQQPAKEARAIFNDDLQKCQRIDRSTWRRSRTFWSKLKERWAYFLVARVDPYVARRQLKTLR